MSPPEPMPRWTIHGVDFTSAPRRAKPITVATIARTDDGAYALVDEQALADWAAFDAFLARPGPWIGGFDLPFGLPRPLVEALGWPTDWPALIAHYGALGRDTIRATFKAYCDARPVGAKFAHRATDGPAGSSPSMKWVNPPVAWMLHAGVPRLLAAGVHLPGYEPAPPAPPTRVALEVYPGWLARSITRASYKSDARTGQTDARRAAREVLVDAIEDGRHALGMPVAIDPARRRALVADGSADRLDALLCAVEAAWAWQRHADGHPRYGLPDAFDPIEGWIVGVERPRAVAEAA